MIITKYKYLNTKSPKKVECDFFHYDKIYAAHRFDVWNRDTIKYEYAYKLYIDGYLDSEFIITKESFDRLKNMINLTKTKYYFILHLSDDDKKYIYANTDQIIYIEDLGIMQGFKSFEIRFPGGTYVYCYEGERIDNNK